MLMIDLLKKVALLNDEIKDSDCDLATYQAERSINGIVLH